MFFDVQVDVSRLAKFARLLSWLLIALMAFVLPQDLRQDLQVSLGIVRQ